MNTSSGGNDEGSAPPEKRSRRNDADAADERETVPVPTQPQTRAADAQAWTAAQGAPQLPYRRRLDAVSPHSTERPRCTRLQFVPWTGNVDQVYTDECLKNHSDLSEDIPNAVELWECDEDGNPSRVLHVAKNTLLKLTAASAALHPTAAGLLQTHDSGQEMPRAVLLFTLPPPAPGPAHAGPSDAEVLANVRAVLDGIPWDGIVLKAPVLTRSVVSVFKVDLLANPIDSDYMPEMTLVEHPDDFGTIIHANQVLQRMKAKKGPLIGIGPSGCGKTRLLFDLASFHPSVYFECEGTRIGQADVRAFTDTMLAVAGITTVEREMRMRHCFHALLLARLLLLERFRAYIGHDAWDDRIHCKQWLVAQLDGVPKIGADLFELLCSTTSEAVLHELRHVSDRANLRVHYLFDEAHMWHNSKFGAYTTSEDKQTQDSQRRPLFTKAVNLATLSIGELADSQSAFALGSGGGPSSHIVAGFRSLSKANVKAVLAHFLDVSDAAVSVMAKELVGRGRLSNEFIATCYRKHLENETAVLAEFKRYRSLLLSATVEDWTLATSRSFVTVWTTLLRGQPTHSIALSLLAHILWQGPSTYTVPLRFTRDGVLALPDLVLASLAFVDGVTDLSLDQVAFKLSMDEPWSWQVGVSVLCQLGQADALLQERAERLSWATVSAGVRGTNVELLIAIALRLAHDLPDRIKRLVDGAQALSSPLKLPDWFEPWRCELKQPRGLYTSSTLEEARVDLMFRDTALTVHIHEHAARVDLSYFGVVAAIKTASSKEGVDASVAGDNRRTLAPESYYRTTKGEPNAAAQSQRTAVDAAVKAWPQTRGLLCLDIVLPFSAAKQHPPPRLEVRTADDTGRQDVYVHVDRDNLGILIGDGVANSIIAALIGARAHRDTDH